MSTHTCLAFYLILWGGGNNNFDFIEWNGMVARVDWNGDGFHISHSSSLFNNIFLFLFVVH